MPTDAMDLFSFPPEIQRRIVAQMAPAEMILLVDALRPTPNLLNGVFQLITNHGKDSFVFEDTGTVIPHIRLEEYDPSKHRALINLVELVDFFHVDQKKLYRQLSHKTNFIYVFRKREVCEYEADELDDSSDIEELSDEDYEDLSADEDEDPTFLRECIQDVRRHNRLRTFFERFLPFSKIFFYKMDLQIDMSRCPDLTDVTLAAVDELILKHASSRLPQLMGVGWLLLKDPTKEVFEKNTPGFTQGIVKEFTAGNEDKVGPGFEMTAQFLYVETMVSLNHFHTIRGAVISCKTLQMSVCDSPTGKPPFINRFWLLNADTLSLSYKSQPPVLSGVAFSTSIRDLQISEDEFDNDGNEIEHSAEQVSVFMEDLFQHMKKLKTLYIRGKNAVNTLLTNDKIHSSTLTSLSLSFFQDQEASKIKMACTRFPNITSLAVQVTAPRGILDQLPKIVAPKLLKLKLVLQHCTGNSDNALADFFNQFPSTVTSLDIRSLFGPVGVEAGVDTSNFKEILSPISSQLVSLKLSDIPLEFMTDTEKVMELPELKELRLGDGPIPTGLTAKCFELNVLAPKLEELRSAVDVDGPTIIKNFPLLKSIRMKGTTRESILLENLPELTEFSNTSYYAQPGKTTARNLPKLEVVRFPYWPGGESELPNVFQFDETVNPNFRLDVLN